MHSMLRCTVKGDAKAHEVCVPLSLAVCDTKKTNHFHFLCFFFLSLLTYRLKT